MPSKGPREVEHPRLLVLSEVIPERAKAGSIIMHRLLAEWPPERLLVMGPPVEPGPTSLACRYVELVPPLRRLRFSRWAETARTMEVLGLFPRLRARDVTVRLDGFVPDAVVSVMQSLCYYGTAERFARESGLPLVLIVHDIPEDFERVAPWAARLQLRRNERIYRYASARLCVSPEIRDFLARKYGADGDVMYPGPADGILPRPISKARSLVNPPHLTVGYAGSLAYGYGHQLEMMAPAFREAGTKLRLYSSWAFSCVDGVVEHVGPSPTAEETWSRIQRECDAVILAYSWPDYGHQELYRTHFPSKLPEYLQLGLPVIIVGPPDAAGVSWGLRNPEAAITIARNEPGQWARELMRLRRDDALRESLASSAVVAAGRDFDPGRIRDSFSGCVREVASAKLDHRSGTRPRGRGCQNGDSAQGRSRKEDAEASRFISGTGSSDCCEK